MSEPGASAARRLGAAALAVAVLLGGAALAAAMLSRPRATTLPPRPSMTTAAVTLGTVSERILVPGVLGFDGVHSVTHQGQPGILTSTAAPGTVVRPGGVLYAVANQPVRLLLGTVPAYRDLARGIADGPDVKQLERNLAAMGHDPGRIDNRFTAATAAAVRRWEAALGVPAAARTGSLPLGQVVFAPVALRVTQVQAVVGTAIAPDEPVLTASSPDRVVTARLPADRRHDARPGDKVRVSLSDLALLDGTVIRVGPAVPPTPSPDGNGEDAPPTAPLTVRVDLPAGTPDLDQAPAQVAITVTERTGVLLVPVMALLARPGGGYQVELASGEYVPVQPGLFDSMAGTVEVTGALTEGQALQVPAT